mgnify:CR=1 FL=1
MAVEIKAEHPHIVRVPGVIGGEPIIAGTRISVASVARFLQDGAAPDEILEMYPHLTKAGVYDAISYYFDHSDEIERIIAESQPEAVRERMGYTVDEKGLASFTRP